MYKLLNIARSGEAFFTDKNEKKFIKIFEQKYRFATIFY